MTQHLQSISVMLLSIWKAARNFQWVQHCTPVQFSTWVRKDPSSWFALRFPCRDPSEHHFTYVPEVHPPWPQPAPHACRTWPGPRVSLGSQAWLQHWHMDLQFHVCAPGWWPYAKDIQHDWQCFYCILHHSCHSFLCTNSHTGACKQLQQCISLPDIWFIDS